MNLFELFVKIGVDDQASGKLSKLSASLGKGLATAAKIGTAAVSAAAAGITALTTAAVNNYAEYEQLVGGVDTLFKDASQKVQKYAADAYKTAGMSANDYMENATAFSASLISALGDDTEAAAEYANRAMVSMSDNANKMGTSLDSIVQTYQSLSRGNFAMLDNLKLGYGGTKAELERLIADAASYTEIQKEMGITVDASSTSFDNIVNAIAVVQGKLGIAGATALEAGTTIEGSVNSMKAAWDNLITGVADKNADIEGLIGDFVTTIVGDGTESNLGVLGNIMPAVKSALNGASRLVSEMIPIIVQEIPAIINDNLPILVEAAISIIQSLVDGIDENRGMLMETAFSTIVFLSKSFISMLPQIVEFGLDLVVSLAEGIVENLDELLPAVLEAIESIGMALIEYAPKLINSGIELASAIIEGTLEKFGDFAPLIAGVVAAFVSYNSVVNAGKIATAAMTIATKAAAAAQWLVNAALNANPIGIVVALIAGLVTAIVTLWHTNEDFRKALISAWNAIKNIAIAVWGSIVKFFTEDIPNAFNAVINFVEDNWQSLLLLIVNPIAGALNLLYDINPKFKEWVDNLISKIKSWIGGMVNIGKEIVSGLKNGIKKAWGSVIDWFSGAFDSLKEVFSDWGGFFAGLWQEACSIFSSAYFEFLQIGRNIVNGIREGIRNTWQSFKNWFNNLWDSLFKNRNIDVGIYGGGSGGGSGGVTGPGAGAGGMYSARDVVFNNSMIPTNAKNDSSSQAVFGDIYINVYASEYENQKDLVEEIAQRLQSMTERRSAVYA